MFVGYSLEQKGYRCYNPLTREIRVSRLNSWYGGKKVMHVDEEKEDTQVKEVQQESTVLSGPKSSAQTPLKVNPWSGRLRSPSASPNASVGSTGKNVNSAKGKKKVDQPMAIFYVSEGHSMADHDSSGEESVDEEFGIPKVQNPGVRRSTCVKYPVERLKYDSFAAHHFMYMANVVQVQEPTSFSDAIGVKQWNVAMDEEMNALDDSGTLELTPLPK